MPATWVAAPSQPVHNGGYRAQPRARSDYAAWHETSASRMPSADSALNGIVLLGEGGRVQIAVLCSTLGFGAPGDAGRLVRREDGPVGLVGAGRVSEGCPVW